MLKCGDVVTKWMAKICELAWGEGRGSSRLEKRHHCPSLQGEGQERECGSYRGMSPKYSWKGIWKSHNRECVKTYRRENQ